MGSKEHKEALKKVQNNPAFKAEESKIQKDLEQLRKDQDALSKKFEKMGID